MSARIDTGIIILGIRRNRLNAILLAYSMTKS